MIPLLHKPILRSCSVVKNVVKLSSRFISKQEIRAQNMLNELHTSVRSQKFEDIVVIRTDFDSDPRYLILANAFNERHLLSGTEEVNKQFKRLIKNDEDRFGNLSISKEWNVLDYQSVVVHLFSRSCRKHFDIEQLWSVGEQYDDLTNFGQQDPETLDDRYSSMKGS